MSAFMGGRTVLKMKPVLTIGCVGNVTSYIIALLALPDSSLYTYTKELPILILP